MPTSEISAVADRRYSVWTNLVFFEASADIYVDGRAVVKSATDLRIP
jgi:hypothetical protein